jgi:hypothetical protein
MSFTESIEHFEAQDRIDTMTPIDYYTQAKNKEM